MRRSTYFQSDYETPNRVVHLPRRSNALCRISDFGLRIFRLDEAGLLLIRPRRRQQFTRPQIVQQRVAADRALLPRWVVNTLWP